MSQTGYSHISMSFKEETKFYLHQCSSLTGHIKAKTEQTIIFIYILASKCSYTDHFLKILTKMFDFELLKFGPYL